MFAYVNNSNVQLGFVGTYFTDLRCPLSQGFCSPAAKFTALLGILETPIIGDTELPVFFNESNDDECIVAVVELGAPYLMARGWPGSLNSTSLPLVGGRIKLQGRRKWGSRKVYVGCGARAGARKFC